MELDSRHLPAAYNFGFAPRKSVHSCIMQLWPVPALRTHQTEGSHIVSYGKKVCCVFRRCNCAISDYTKTHLQTKGPQTFMNLFNRSFIHSLIRLTNFVMAIHKLTVKQEDKFPTITTQPELWTLTAKDALSFGKYQGLWHMMQRGETLRSCPTCRMQGTRYSNVPRWTNLKLYVINRDTGMRLWKSTIKPDIYSHDATYLRKRNLVRLWGEFKGTRWKHHVMKTGTNIYIVKWLLHKPGWLYNEIGESETL